MQTIDVHDLPESVAQVVAEIVRTLREQLPQSSAIGGRPITTWPLGSPASLKRSDIYRDYLDGKIEAHTS